MYGGLFGDLPAAKASNQQTSKQQQAQTSTSTTNEASGSTNVPAVKRLIEPPVFMPVTKKPANNQMIQAIGTAGTSMAFVPTAARRKKKSRLGPTPSAAINSKTQAENSSISCLQQQQQQRQQPPLNTIESSSTWQPTVHTTITTTTALATSAHSPTVQHIHPQHIAAPIDSHYHPHQHEDEENDMEEIKDVYDPYVPNDLLQYWDRQALAKKRETLELETKQALKKQRALRIQLEKEREELQKKGDYSKLLAGAAIPAAPSAGGMGRGRGRGVSNLPAWLIEQKRKEQELGRAT